MKLYDVEQKGLVIIVIVRLNKNGRQKSKKKKKFILFQKIPTGEVINVST